MPRVLRLAVTLLACLSLASLSTPSTQAATPSGVSGTLLVPAGDDPADYSVVALTAGCSPGADLTGFLGTGVPVEADGSFSLDVPATQCAMVFVESSTASGARPILTTPDGVPSMYVSTRAGTAGLRLTVAPTTNLTVRLPADLAGEEITSYLATAPAHPDLPTIVRGTWVSDTQVTVTADGDGATATLPLARGGRYTLYVSGPSGYYGQYMGGFPSAPDPFDPDATFVASSTPTSTIELDPFPAREVTVTLPGLANLSGDSTLRYVTLDDVAGGTASTATIPAGSDSVTLPHLIPGDYAMSVASAEQPAGASTAMLIGSDPDVHIAPGSDPVQVTLHPHAVSDASVYTGAPTSSALHVTTSGTPRIDAPLTAHVSVDADLSAEPGFQLHEYWVTDGGRVVGTGDSVATPLVAGLWFVAVVTSDTTPMLMASTTVVSSTTMHVTVGEPPRLLADGGIAGSATTGQTLTLRPTRWTYDPDSVSVRWTRDGVVIPGATGSAYVVTSADVGARLGVELTAHRLWHDDGTATITMPDVVHAAPATRTPTPPVRPTTRTTRLKTRLKVTVRHARRLTPRKHAHLRVKIKAKGGKKAGTPITGRITVTVAHHKKITTKVTKKRHGRRTVRLPRLNRGKHKVVVRFHPTHHAKKVLTRAKKKTRVRIHKR